MRLGRIGTLFFLTLLSCSVAEARDTTLAGVDLQFYRPAVDSFGYFGVNGPRLQRAGEYHLQLSQSFAFGPLFGITVNNLPVDLVGHLLTTDLVGSVGLASFLTVAIDLPFHLYAREADFNTLLSFTTWSLGDLKLLLKWRLLEEGPRRPGLALLVSSTVPTGNDRKFLGSHGTVPSADLILGKEWRNFRFAINTGARFVPRRDVLGIIFDDQITYGAGFAVPIRFIDPTLSLMGEVRGHFQPRGLEVRTAPVEFETGLRKDFRNGLSLLAAAGGGWNNATGNPKVRGLFSISWSPTVKRIPSAEGPDKIRTTAYFRRGRSHPTDESAVWVRDAGSWMKSLTRKRVIVEGHTDGTGSPKSNRRLAQRRAEMVRGLLVETGVKPDRVEIRSYGEERPVGTNETAVGRRLNRRVEILPVD